MGIETQKLKTWILILITAAGMTIKNDRVRSDKLNQSQMIDLHLVLEKSQVEPVVLRRKNRRPRES